MNNVYCLNGGSVYSLQYEDYASIHLMIAQISVLEATVIDYPPKNSHIYTKISKKSVHVHKYILKVQLLVYLQHVRFDINIISHYKHFLPTVKEARLVGQWSRIWANGSSICDE